MWLRPLWCVPWLALSACSYLPFGAPPPVAEPAPPLINVKVDGVRQSVVANIRAHVSLTSKPCTTPRAYVRVLSQRAKGEALKALQALGHYHASVAVTVERTTDCPTVRLEVVEGPRIMVRDVTVSIFGEAALDAGFSRALKHLPIKRGQGLNHQKYTDTKALIESLARQRGYREGRFVRHLLRVNPDAGFSDIVIEYDSGPRYRMGEIQIEQEPPSIDDALVKRFVEYTPGAHYESALVSKFYENLSASDYFQTIQVRP